MKKMKKPEHVRISKRLRKQINKARKRGYKKIGKLLSKYKSIRITE